MLHRQRARAPARVGHQLRQVVAGRKGRSTINFSSKPHRIFIALQLYVSASNDGSIKVWDGVSSQCVSTFPGAHDGAPVSSVTFTRNGKYVLSAGKDSLVKLWELSTTRCLIAYTGAGATGASSGSRAQSMTNRLWEGLSAHVYVFLHNTRLSDVVRNEMAPCKAIPTLFDVVDEE